MVLKGGEEEERGRAGALAQNRKGGGKGFLSTAAAGTAGGESFGPQRQPKHPKPRGDSKTHNVMGHLQHTRLLPLQSLGW